MDQQHTLTFIDTGPDHKKVPDVSKGQMRGFIIGKRNQQNGRSFTLYAWYLNAYSLDYGGEPCPQCPGPDGEGMCPAEHLDGCPTTGWFYDESNFEHDNCYHRIEGIILAFAEIPKYQTPDQTSENPVGGHA